MRNRNMDSLSRKDENNDNARRFLSMSILVLLSLLIVYVVSSQMPSEWFVSNDYVTVPASRTYKFISADGVHFHINTKMTYKIREGAIDSLNCRADEIVTNTMKHVVNSMLSDSSNKMLNGIDVYNNSASLIHKITNREPFFFTYTEVQYEPYGSYSIDSVMVNYASLSMSNAFARRIEAIRDAQAKIQLQEQLIKEAQVKAIILKTLKRAQASDSTHINAELIQAKLLSKIKIPETYIH